MHQHGCSTCSVYLQDIYAHSLSLSEHHTAHGNEKSLLSSIEARFIDCSGAGFNCFLRCLCVAGRARYSVQDCAGIADFPNRGYNGGRVCVKRKAQEALDGTLITGFPDQFMAQVCGCKSVPSFELVTWNGTGFSFARPGTTCIPISTLIIFPKLRIRIASIIETKSWSKTHENR